MEKAFEKLLPADPADYCFCNCCNRMVRSKDIEADSEGHRRCLTCGGSDFADSAWVICPYHKMTAVKCPRGGKGLFDTGHGVECSDRCFFRGHK